MDDDPHAAKYAEMVLHLHCESEDFVNIRQEPVESTSDVQIKVCDWHTDKVFLPRCM